MTSMTPDLYDYITRTNADLVRAGVDPLKINAERLRRTGHSRRISPRWAPSIGMWGGVQSLRDIATSCDASTAQAHAWAQYRQLTTRTRARKRTQALLAVHALATPGPARVVGPALGILPVEVCLYRAAAEALRVESGAALREMLTWDPVYLERTWASLGLAVEYAAPPPLVLREQFAQAFTPYGGVRVHTSTIARALAIAERELPGLFDGETASGPADLLDDGG
jgi:hypothetical protein